MAGRGTTEIINVLGMPPPSIGVIGTISAPTLLFFRTFIPHARALRTFLSTYNFGRIGRGSKNCNVGALIAPIELIVAPGDEA